MTTQDHITTKAREDAILWTKDQRLARQFATRKEAALEAKRLGFPSKSPARIEIMGFQLWALMDDHCRYITRTGYAQLRQEREEIR